MHSSSTLQGFSHGYHLQGFSHGCHAVRAAEAFLILLCKSDPPTQACDEPFLFSGSSDSGSDRPSQK